MKYTSSTARLLTVIILVLVLQCFVNASLEIEQIGSRIYAGEGYMELSGPLPFMHLKGSPYDIGLQHGTLLAHLELEDTLESMADKLNPLSAKATGLQYLVQLFKKFYFDYKLEPWINRNIPEDLYKELEGIVYGVSKGEDTNPKDLVLGNVAQDLGMTFACTSMTAFGAATSTGNLYHARNLDHINMLDWAEYGYVVVYEPDEGYPFITHIYPVHAGTMQAMNNQGITVSVNYSLVNQSDIDLDGMGMVFLIRQIVQYASSLEEAVDIVLNTPRTFGLNILISDSKVPDALVIEVDANRYDIRTAKEGILYTANRYNTEYMQQFQSPGWISSARRENRLNEFFTDNYGNITVESMVELLRDRGKVGLADYESLVEGINNAGTILSTVFSPDEQMIWVSFMNSQTGAPDGQFYAYSLTNALNSGDPAVFSRNIKETPSDQNLTNWLLVREAIIAYSKNQFNATLEILDQISPEYSEAEAVVNLKAHVNFRLGNEKEAKHYFQILADRSQLTEPFYHLEAFAMLGAFHDGAGDRTTALSYYAKALGTQVEDLAGNTSFYKRLAEAGLEHPVIVKYTGSGYVFSKKDVSFADYLKAPLPTNLNPNEYNQYNGYTITNVRILGDHVTDEKVVSKLIHLRQGESFSAGKFYAAKRRLLSIQAFERAQMYVIPIDKGYVDIVVRLNEGFGFYLDPVDFVIRGIMNLSQKTIALSYYNIGGKLISVGGEYSFGSNNRRVFNVTLPALTFPTTMRYQSETQNTKLVWGEHSGSVYSTDKTDISLTTEALLGSNSSISFGAGLSKSVVTELDSSTNLDVFSNEYYLLSTTIQTGLSGKTSWTQSGTRVNLGASVLANRSDVKENYPRVSLRLKNSSYLGRGFVARFELAGAWTKNDTPYDRRFRLGGSGQLGANSPIFVGEMYAYSNTEIQRYLTTDLAAHVNFETAFIWENSTKIDVSSQLYSIGCGLTYQTPIGLPVRAKYSKNLSLPNIYSMFVGIVAPF